MFKEVGDIYVYTHYIYVHVYISYIVTNKTFIHEGANTFHVTFRSCLDTLVHILIHYNARRLR